MQGGVPAVDQANDEKPTQSGISVLPVPQTTFLGIVCFAPLLNVDAEEAPLPWSFEREDVHAVPRPDFHRQVNLSLPWRTPGFPRSLVGAKRLR